MPDQSSYARYKALIALRNGPVGRNDAELERATRSVHAELMGRFSRDAFLVRSLQVCRLSRGRGDESGNLFLDEREAQRYLTEAA